MQSLDSSASTMPTRGSRCESASQAKGALWIPTAMRHAGSGANHRLEAEVTPVFRNSRANSPKRRFLTATPAGSPVFRAKWHRRTAASQPRSNRQSSFPRRRESSCPSFPRRRESSDSRDSGIPPHDGGVKSFGEKPLDSRLRGNDAEIPPRYRLLIHGNRYPRWLALRSSRIVTT